MARCIGGGSYGEVWLARSVIGTWRAVKVVHRRTFEDDRPFEREFQGIQKFEPISRSHEGLVDVLQVGQNSAAGYFYYVMELAHDAAKNPNDEIQNPKEIRNPKIEACAPREAIRTSSFGLASSFDIRRSEFYIPRTLRHDLNRQGGLPFDKCVQIGLALARALEHLHRHGQVHRDIKPSNRLTDEDLKKCVEYINQAIQIDPEFTPAYVTLFEVSVWATADMPFEKRVERQKEIATKLDRIAPNLGEAHACISWVKWNENDAKGAEEEIKRAIRLNPNYATAYAYYGSYLVWRGRVDEAPAKFKRAQELDPASPVHATVAGWRKKTRTFCRATAT